MKGILRNSRSATVFEKSSTAVTRPRQRRPTATASSATSGPRRADYRRLADDAPGRARHAPVRPPRTGTRHLARHRPPPVFPPHPSRPGGLTSQVDDKGAAHQVTRSRAALTLSRWSNRGAAAATPVRANVGLYSEQFLELVLVGRGGAGRQPGDGVRVALDRVAAARVPRRSAGVRQRLGSRCGSLALVCVRRCSFWGVSENCCLGSSFTQD
jgi:hypothetical protein